jgi:hypothetical protein
MTTSTTADEQPRRMWRRVTGWVMVVLMGIAVAGSVIGFWANRTVLETDRFMAVVTPIVESESVQAVVSDRVSDQLIEALDLETRLQVRLSQAEARLREGLADALELPDRIVQRLENARLGLDSLAPMIAAGVETRIREAVSALISSPQGTQLLLNTIEIAHERSVLLLRDEMDQLPNVVVTEGEVRLNLVPLMAEVLRSVINAGLDIVGLDRENPPFDSSEDATAAVERLAGIVGRDLPPDFGQVRIASEEGLERAQGLVRAFDIALWALLIVAIVFGVLAVWLAPSIAVGAIRVGAAAALAALAGWLLVQFLSAQVADAATTPEGRMAVGEIIQSLVSGLNGTAFALGVIGIGVLASGFIVDRQSRQAVATAGAGGEPPAPEPPPAAPAATDATAAVATSSAPRRARRRSTAAASAEPQGEESESPAADAQAAEASRAEAPGAEAPAEAPAEDASAASTDESTAGEAPTTDSTEAAPKPPSTTRKRRRPPAAGA